MVATRVTPSNTLYLDTCLIKTYPVQAARKNSKTEAASEDTYFSPLFVKTKVLCGTNDPIIMEICHVVKIVCPNEHELPLPSKSKIKKPF